MPKPLKRRELIRRLKKHGFEGPCSGGRHQFMMRGTLKLVIPNPHYGELSGAFVAEILKQAGIDSNDW